MDELNEENLTYKTYKTIDEQIRYLKENVSTHLMTPFNK